MDKKKNQSDKRENPPIVEDQQALLDCKALRKLGYHRYIKRIGEWMIPTQHSRSPITSGNTNHLNELINGFLKEVKLVAVGLHYIHSLLKM